MLNGLFIWSKQFDKGVPFHDPLKRLKLITLVSDSVLKKDNVKTTTLPIYYVKIYVTPFSKSSDLRNLENH